MGTYTTWMCFTQKYFGITEAGPPQDVKEVFKEYADSGSYMTVKQLRRFLVEFQGDCDASVADAEWIVEEVLHRRHLNVKLTRQKDLTLEDFHYYLFSVDLNPPINNQVHQDMGAPLSHYFIYTGHNSYLTGNQLSSDCSDVPIIKALKRGLRAVELDLWSNSAKDDVLVLHGWTLTTPVELIKCLRSIKEHAFSASPYPVIITLEDHLTPDLQAKVAQMVTQTFGDMLFYPEPECLNEFPSPEELKYRIIISTTPPKEYLDGKTASNGKLFNSQKERNSDEDVSGRGSLDLTTETCGENEKSDCDKSEHNQYSGDSDACDPVAAPAYKRLIAIPARKPNGGLRKKLRVELGDTVRRLSLSEQKFEKATMSYAADVVRFTQKNILRIYPRAARVNSSNYNPLIGWTHGAQMVALNMQGYGKCLWLMHGMFRSNGGCGYVKKPDFLMSVGPDDQVYDPKAKLPVRKIVKVKLYMGDGWHVDFKEKTHSSFWSPPDLYAKVGIAGVARDKKMKKTKKRKGNGTPGWDEEFEFSLTVPELALLRIVFCEYNMSEKNYFAGQTCLPVSELRPGIHAVPLFNRKGERYSSVRLLMRFQIEQVNIIPP